MTIGPSYGGSAGHGGPGGYGRPAGGPMYGGAMAARAQTLAADADRERAVEFLKTAFTEGRLTKDDYDTRVGRVLSARTYADLDAITADLPQPGFPAYPAMGFYPVPRKTNSLATASLVCGIGQVMLWPLITIPAIVLGHMARSQIRRTGEEGSGLALAGLILGYVGLGVALLALVGVLFLVAAVTSSSGTG